MKAMISGECGDNAASRTTTFNVITGTALDEQSVWYPFSIRTVKTLRRLTAVLLCLLTIGVGQMRAASVVNGGHVYFDILTSGWSVSDVQFVIGHGSYSEFYNMSAVANTKLYYISANSWGDATYFAFANNCSGWGSEGSSYDNRKNYISGKYTATKTGYTLNGSNLYVFNASSSANNATVNSNSPAGHQGTAYSSMNKTITFRAKTSIDGAAYSDVSTPGKLTASSYAFNSVSTCNTSKSATLNAGNSSTTISCGYTATTTFTAADATGYEFVGWYDSSGNQLTTNKTLTVYPRQATTYYAYYRTFTVRVTTISPSAGGSATPTSWTNMSPTSGGSITATANTGYTFSGWSILSGGGGYFGTSGTETTSSTPNTTFRPTKSSQLKATFTPNDYTITLNGNGGTGGTATATYAASTLKSITHASRAGYTLNGYYTEASTGSKVINADGSLNNVSGWVSGGYWSKASNGTLYAQWTENLVYYTLNFTYGTSSTGNVTVTAKNSSTNASISYGASLLSGTGVTVTAAPEDHYKFVGWYSNRDCTTLVSTDNPYSFTISANTNLYAKVEYNTTAITLDRNNGTAGTESITATYGSALPSFTAHTRSGYTLQGYYTNASGGTKIINANGTLVASTTYANASSKWNSDAASLTLYAQWTEIMTTVTIDASPAGAGTFTVGGSTVTSTSAGVSTKPQVTAVPAVGYKTAATIWTKNNTYITLSSTTANPTTVTGCGTANTSSTLTGNFVRIYAFIEGRFQVRNATRTTTTRTYASGDWDEASVLIPLSYDADNHRFYLRTYSTPKELSAQLEGYNPYFYIKTSTSSSSLAGTSTYWSNTSTTLTTAGVSNGKTVGSSGANDRLRFNSTDESGWVILYFDQSKIWYELEPATYNCKLWYYSGKLYKGTTGTKVDMTYDNTEAAYYKDITTNSSPFYFRFLYDNSVEWSCDWSAYPDGKVVVANGEKVDANIDVTSWDDHSACRFTGPNSSSIRIWFDSQNKKTWITEPGYSVTINNGTNGTVSPNGSKTVGASGITITATPAEGYKFVSWTVTGGARVASATAHSTTLTATAAGTVTATYAAAEKVRLYYKNTNGWSNVYAYLWDNDNTSDKNAGWPGTNIASKTVLYNCDTYHYYEFYMDSHPAWNRVIFNDGSSGQTADITFSSSNANQYYIGSAWVAEPTNPWDLRGSWDNWASPSALTCTSATSGYAELTLNANTPYSFKFVENGSTWYGATTVTQITYSNKGTAQTMNNTSDTGQDQTILTAGSGTYRFTWDLSLKKVTVTYPTSYTITYSATTVSGTNGQSAAPTATYNSGAVTVASGGYVPSGTSVTFTAAAAKAGYTFNGWYTAATGGTQKSTALSYSETISANTTRYARYTQNTFAVTLTNESSTYGTVNTSSPVTVGQAEAVQIKATPKTGYKFKAWVKTAGSGTISYWTAAGLSGSTDASGASKATTYIKTTGTATLQATYEEDLTSTWIVAGGNKIVTTGTAWRTTADANNMMMKKTGESTLSVVYFYVTTTGTNLGNTNEAYKFKIFNTSGSTWYGLDGTDQYSFERAESGIAKNLSTTGCNIELRADVAGTYEIKVDYRTATPKITITFPASYAVNFGVSPSAAANAITTSPSITSGSQVLAGTSVTFSSKTAKTGFTWAGWYNNAAQTSERGETQTETPGKNRKIHIFRIVIVDVSFDFFDRSL